MYGNYKSKCKGIANEMYGHYKWKCMGITNPMYLPIILGFYDNVFTNLVGIFFAEWTSYTGV